MARKRTTDLRGPCLAQAACAHNACPALVSPIRPVTGVLSTLGTCK